MPDTITESEARGTVKGVIALIIYIAAIVAANALTAHFGIVPVGFGLLVTAGTYAAGFALLARDFVQRYLGVRWALAGVAFGIILSWVLATPALALASAAAFACAELVDTGLFTIVRRRGFVRAALLSCLVSAPIDTVVFLGVAGFPLTWQSVLGQFIGKVLWATVVPLAIYVMVRRALLRKSVNSESA